MHSENLSQRFENIFGSSPKVFRAPGRVNLIGEHTDYNDGFVMPAAIGYKTWVAVSARPDRKLVLHSEEFPQHFEFDIENLPAQPLHAWCDYVVGVAVMLKQDGVRLPGANLLVRSDVPIGAGLSSSAALEVASALAFMNLSAVQIEKPRIAMLCRRAENDFVGARVGIMDQFVSCLGQAGHALMLDCRSLDFQLIPIPKSVRLVICNTMVKHELAKGEYNRRREECDEGVKLLSQWYPGIRALRDVSPAQLEQHSSVFPSTIFKRCTHVVRENQRVEDGAKLLVAGDLRGFGKLMGESHCSLRDLYEVSCRELDTMVEIADGTPGYWGGRMTGGGFGGCTVNLVNAADAAVFAQQIAQRYRQQTSVRPEVYICETANGAGPAGDDIEVSSVRR